ncbi:MAG: acyl-CoA reductase [Candidatus Thermoplasmatota archaeon]|nr:acyl-CoA reductase [Candidatus Thermoplasmatota archaeon]
MNVVFNEPVAISGFFEKFDERKREKSELISSFPSREILTILDRVRGKWRAGSYREAAMEKLPELTGFSESTVEEGLNMLCDILSKKNLERRIKTELGCSLDGWGGKGNIRLFAVPLGSTLHVLAGNIFVSGIESLVNGIITKNLNVVKVPSSGRLFPYLFLRSVEECSPELASTISMISFKGGNKRVEKKLKERMDGIIVWGGMDAVQSYKRDLPPGKVLIEHGPKCGVGVVEDLEENLAKNIAMDVVSWEQRSCASLQVLYIKREMRDLIKDVGRELDGFSENPLDRDHAVEVMKAKEIARMGKAFGDYDYFFSEEPLKWQAIFTKGFELSPLGRTLYVREYDDIKEVIREIPKEYTQTVAISSKRDKEIGKMFAEAGATRIVRFGRMTSGAPGAPHDGDFPLRELVRLCGMEL